MGYQTFTCTGLYLLVVVVIILFSVSAAKGGDPGESDGNKSSWGG